MRKNGRGWVGKPAFCGVCVLEKLETLSDCGVIWGELGSTGITVDRVRSLVVTLIEAAKVEPNFGHVGVDAKSTVIGVECVAGLVDLGIENADGAPKCRVAAITIDSLLIGFVGLLVH